MLSSEQMHSSEQVYFSSNIYVSIGLRVHAKTPDMDTNNTAT